MFLTPLWSEIPLRPYRMGSVSLPLSVQCEAETSKQS